MSCSSKPAPSYNRKNTTPKLIVCVVTYNQKNYISKCLQSLVDQKTNFPFEILVGDDCSTDGTSEIVQEFANKYPNQVIHWRHDTNVGAYQNYILTHDRAAKQRCIYTAHMDGDDCALPSKLQAQVNVLDENPQVALSAHAVRVMGRAVNIGDICALPEFAGIENLLGLGTYFVNSSTMYRTINYVPRDADQIVVDFQHYIEQAKLGDIHLNKKILGEYRWHSEGISKNPAHREKIEAAYEAAFDLAMNMGVSSRFVTRSRLKRRMSFALAALVDGKEGEFRKKIRLAGKDWFYASMKHRALALGNYLIQGKIKIALIRKLTKYYER